MNPFPQSCHAHRLLEEIRAQIPEAALCPRAAGPKSWDTAVLEPGDEELLGGRVLDVSMASAVRSGLLLRADRLDTSHGISQKIETPTGSYWHGIMHRREGDFSNSKYWFRRVGEHPIFPGLAQQAAAVIVGDVDGDAGTVFASGRWDPFAFVDLCKMRFQNETDELAAQLRALQELEIAELLAFCRRGALGE